MRLSEALGKLIPLELKMSEVYLWCSINFEDLELRQFFSDMSDQELAHARALESIGQSPRIGGISLEMPEQLPQRVSRSIKQTFELVKNERAIDRAFLQLAEMEGSEINQAFDSILKGVNDAGIEPVDLLKTNTRRHILMLARQAEKLNLSEKVRKKIEQICVTDRDYFRLFAQ